MMMEYNCGICSDALQNHTPTVIKSHMDGVFKNLKCKKCDSENYIVTKKGTLMIISHCNDCQHDSQWFWFGVIK